MLFATRASPRVILSGVRPRFHLRFARCCFAVRLRYASLRMTRRTQPNPQGRCVASGSTRGKDVILARDPARLCLALLRSSTSLRYAQDDTGVVSLCVKICLSLSQRLSRKKDRECKTLSVLFLSVRVYCFIAGTPWCALSISHWIKPAR